LTPSSRFTPSKDAVFETQSNTGLNINSSGAVTASFDIHGHKYVAWSGALATGTWAAAVVTLQSSLDGTNWFDTASTLTAAGLKDNVQVSALFVRAKVTTVESGVGTADIYFVAK